MSGIAGIQEIDGDLGVLDPIGGAGVLALHAYGLGALLEISGLVDDQHRLGVAKALDQIGAEVIADAVLVPHRPAEQMLHPIRLGLPACSAIVQQFLRGRSESSPRTNALARRRGSTRPNRPATRPSSSSRPACQRAGSTFRLWPAATV